MSEDRARGTPFVFYESADVFDDGMIGLVLTVSGTSAWVTSLVPLRRITDVSF